MSHRNPLLLPPTIYTNCLLTHHFNQATPLAIDLCQECSSAVSSFLVVNQSRNAMSFGHAEIVVVKTPTSGVTNDGNFVKWHFLFSEVKSYFLRDILFHSLVLSCAYDWRTVTAQSGECDINSCYGGLSGAWHINQDLLCKWVQHIRFSMIAECSKWPWASYQIGKIAGCACAGNAGTFSPAVDFKGNRYLANPACITARALRTCRDACRDRLPAVAGKTFPAFPAHAHMQFYLSGKRPIHRVRCWWSCVGCVMELNRFRAFN